MTPLYRALGVHGARRLWYMISEPRFINFMAWLGYLALTLGAITVLFNPPMTIEGLMGATSAYSMGYLVLIGGLIGVSSALQGWWFLERWGVIALISGAAIYGGTTLVGHLVGDGNRLWLLAFIIFALTSLCGRLSRVIKRQIDPSTPNKLTCTTPKMLGD